MQWFAWIEQTAIGLWVREAPTIWAFPFVLLLHTVGLAIVGGTGVILNAFAWRDPNAWQAGRVEPWFRFAWFGFAVNFVSGILLLAAYPAKALTNPVFYVKLLCVIAAMAQLEWLRRQTGATAYGDSAKTRVSPAALQRAIVFAVLMWAGAVFTGRFLAYTHTYLMAADMARGY